jgi:twitching motility protein PilI
MANREALRELQSRLASRLQAARTEGVSASWLAVEAAGGKYLFPLSQSGEIFPLSTTQPVPYTHGWFLGVANLRGGLYGIVDLASFISGGTTAARAEPARTDSRLVALSAVLGVNCALLIDKLSGLRGVDGFASSAQPAHDAPAYFGSRYTESNGTDWQEINLQTLSQQSRFLSISV